MESDLEKNSQLVWCRAWDTRAEMRWFRVDVSYDSAQRDLKRRRTQEDGEVLEWLTPQSINEENNSQSTCVVVGSLICTAGAGDSIYPLDTIRCFDTAKPSSAWKNYKMTTPREFPLMAAMEGKVYIIGGTDDNHRFGEIFDPNTREKKSMLPLPDGFPQSFAVIAAHPKDKRIMLFSCSSDSLFCYNLSENNQGWMELPNRPSYDWTFWLREIGRHNFAVADTTIYWFSQWYPEIFAFDFVANEFSQSDKLEEYEREWNLYQRPPIVLHISGELFFLVWSVPVFDDPLSDNIHFVKVRISKCNAKEPLRVSVVSKRTYLLKSKDDMLFINAVLVNLKTERTVGCMRGLSSEVEEKSNASS